MSRPTVSKAKTSYPIFAATWGRGGHLVVGGGGGAGNHGIKNSITLFDFTSRAPNIQASAELEVSKDDSVTCLAALGTQNGLVLYAGNNSSDEDRSRARNEHFRSFEVQLPKPKRASDAAEKTEASIAVLGKCMLFSAQHSAVAVKEAYQRLIRLSPPPRTATNTPTKRIGAIASSLGDPSELVIFSATSNRPQGQDIIERISFPKNQEANDVDIFDLGEGRFQVAYVIDYEVYIQNVHYDFDQQKSIGKNERRKVYTVPQPDLAGKKARSKLRCIRWLSPKHLLLLANKPNRTGVELVVIHLYEEGPGSVVQRKTLPKHVKAATDMDVALLDADMSGAYQIAIAIGAIDVSLSVYTVDYYGDVQDSLSKIHSFNSYDDVHDVQMTKVIFSTFARPDELARKTAAPQYLRLASTSLGNTISVETFQLQSDGSRHVLQTTRSRNLFTAATYLVIAMVVAVVALLIQSLIDPEGNLTKAIMPAYLQNAAGQQKTFGETQREKRHNAILNNADSTIVKTSHRIADLLHLHLPHVLSSEDSQPSSADKQHKALIIHHDAETDGTLSTEVHDSHEAVLEQHAQAKKWDDLSKEQKKLWRTKLQDAGIWAVEEGETILKSIFFGQIGGLVGQVAEGVLG